MMILCKSYSLTCICHSTKCFHSRLELDFKWVEVPFLPWNEESRHHVRLFTRHQGKFTVLRHLPLTSIFSFKSVISFVQSFIFLNFFNCRIQFSILSPLKSLIHHERSDITIKGCHFYALWSLSSHKVIQDSWELYPDGEYGQEPYWTSGWQLLNSIYIHCSAQKPFRRPPEFLNQEFESTTYSFGAAVKIAVV